MNIGTAHNPYPGHIADSACHLPPELEQIPAGPWSGNFSAFILLPEFVVFWLA